MTALALSLLGEDEDPSLGIFFLQSPSSFVDGYDVVRMPEPESATGMAFLVTPQGVLATCRHVIDALELCPGDQVRLYGLSPELPITVQAEVLAAGSAGIGWEEPVAHRWHPVYGEMLDQRDDVLGEDLALLKIIPGSARAHVIREGDDPPRDARGRFLPIGEPEQWLFAHARTLPAGPPGYSAPGRRLLAWRGVWESGAPVIEQAQAAFQGLAHSRHRLVHVRSEEICPGYSGSPLWDEQRRLVVAMVRQHLTAGTSEIGSTDVRALDVCPGFVLVADRPLRQALAFAAAELEAAMPHRHSTLVEWTSGSGFVEPQLRAVRNGDPLTQGGEGVVPALQLLDVCVQQGRGIILTGQAGSGKSTLLQAFCRSLLETNVFVAGRRLVPFIVHATAFVAARFDLRKVLDTAGGRLGVNHTDAQAFITALHENDARLVLLLDGLDEVRLVDQQQVLAHLSLQAKGPARHGLRPLDRLIHSVLVMSRPSEAIRTVQENITPGGHHVFQVMPFDAQRIHALAVMLYPDMQRQADFLNELQRLRWYKSGASPIQVRIAATILALGAQLPERPSDLISNVLELMLNAAQRELGPGTGLALFRDDILGYLAREAIRESWSLTRENLREHFAEVRVGTACRPWMSDLQALLAFIMDELPGRAPVLAIDEQEQLQWLHRSFIETLAAQWEVRNCGDDSALVARVEQAMQHSGERHPYALALLAAMEREKHLSAVHRILRSCLERPVPGIRPQLLALRALADGIDAGGALREAQVKLLLRIIVTAHNESSYCQEIFSLDELPDPWEILERPELRADVLAALEARFSARRSRLGAKPLRVLEVEARILDRLQLWSAFRNLVSGTQQIHYPTMVGLPMGAGGQGIEGITQLQLRTADGAVELLQMGVTEFIDRVRQADLMTQGRTSAELVNLVVHLIVNEVRER
ncbi:NACHT domain-containing NTPase [Pseudomonas sp. R5(2019)]|uniref:NACHT domain-containing protein n=1 Tax=Pseudomonas sp. R5(2019) TaxID=2697566 RepID=UPI001412DBB4|nr:NACHT domain-containing protein [Pseudomonas sp. R5(2019)]NBA98254.1 NACHT domain-containing protein [Pseudomonas sp. R5(2019)]